MPYPIRMITQTNRTVPAQDAYSQYLQQGAQDNQLKDARNFQMDMATHQSNLAVAREREQAALGQQQQVMAAQLQAHRDQSGAYYGQQQVAQQAGIAEQADYRREGIQGRAAVQHTDLQAQLNDIQLGQAEQARLTRLRQARSSVMADPNLADDEKNNLITQIETGLNPLENRQRQSQIIHQNIQSQQAHQQTQQQATLFNQHQEWLSRGIQGQLQTVTDPQTGAQQLFHVDAQGRIQTLDFSQSQQMHQMRMAGGIQDIAQREQMFPGQLQLQQGQISHQNLSNQQIQELLPRLREMHPLHVQALQGEIANRSQQLATMRQQYEQSGQRFPDELAHLQTQTAAMQEQIAGHQQQRQHAAVMNPLIQGHQTMTNAAQAMTLEGLPQRLETQDALANAHLTRANQEIESHPVMQGLQQQLILGQIDRQTYEQEHLRLQNQILQRNALSTMPQGQVQRLDASIRSEIHRELASTLPASQRSAFARAHQEAGQAAGTPEERLRVQNNLMSAEVNRRMADSMARFQSTQGGGAGAGLPATPHRPFDPNTRRDLMPQTQRAIVAPFDQAQQDVGALYQGDVANQLNHYLDAARTQMARTGTLTPQADAQWRHVQEMIRIGRGGPNQAPQAASPVPLQTMVGGLAGLAQRLGADPASTLGAPEQLRPVAQPATPAGPAAQQPAQPVQPVVQPVAQQQLQDAADHLGVPVAAANNPAAQWQTMSTSEINSRLTPDGQRLWNNVNLSGGHLPGARWGFTANGREMIANWRIERRNEIWRDHQR